MIAGLQREQLQLDCVLWVPAADPPHKQGRRIAAVAHRVEMVTVAIAGNPFIQLSSVDVSRAGPHYTLDMLRLLREQFQPAERKVLLAEPIQGVYERRQPSSDGRDRRGRRCR